MNLFWINYFFQKMFIFTHCSFYPTPPYHANTSANNVRLFSTSVNHWKMGGACGDRVKTIKTKFVAEKVKFFGKKVFSSERLRIKGLFYTSYKMAISVKIPMLKVNYFLYSVLYLAFRPWPLTLWSNSSARGAVCRHGKKRYDGFS